MEWVVFSVLVLRVALHTTYVVAGYMGKSFEIRSEPRGRTRGPFRRPSRSADIQRLVDAEIALLRRNRDKNPEKVDWKKEGF